jgi:CRISPR/Cas system-associated exonuclease Cas4 (RecB family)
MQLWWRNYIHSLNNGILEIIFQDGNKRFEELTFSTPLEEFRLIAKYDLLIFRPDGKVIIIDWKTSQKHPKRSWLADRLQSHVYPFVLSRAASAIIGGNQVDPDQIEMIYWFTNQPELPERFSYNESSYHADTEYLSHLSSTISQISESVFPLTQDVRRCLYCTYRSLCNRGIKPGDLQRLEEWQTQEPISEITIDYDQIGEIEF